MGWIRKLGIHVHDIRYNSNVPKLRGFSHLVSKPDLKWCETNRILAITLRVTLHTFSYRNVKEFTYEVLSKTPGLLHKIYDCIYYLPKVWKFLKSETHLASKVLNKGLWACSACPGGREKLLPKMTGKEGSLTALDVLFHLCGSLFRKWNNLAVIRYTLHLFSGWKAFKCVLFSYGTEFWAQALGEVNNKSNCKQQYTWSHFKMDPELPCQRTGLVPLMPQIFGMLNRGKITFGLGLSNLVPCKRTLCKNSSYD